MESSREKIFSALKELKTQAGPQSRVTRIERFPDLVSKFVEVFRSIGGRAYRIKSLQEIPAFFDAENVEVRRAVSSVPGIFQDVNAVPGTDPRDYHDVNLFVVRASLAVAENGAVWIRESDLPERVLPFITTHLAVVIAASSVVATMHDAYEKIGADDYGFATFIAGPSRTADIEQSLVLGAHGPVSMRVFIEE